MIDSVDDASFHRELESRPELLEQLVADTEEYLSSRLDDADLIYRVTLLVSEAATNAMEHGNQYDARKRVIVDLALQDEGVLATVCDEGDGFDPKSVGDPRLEENLLRSGGRGLFLMKSLADEVTFEAEGRCVRILIRRG